MTDREKTIKELEKALSNMDERITPEDVDKLICTAQDALSLLKAQEPRVLNVHDWEANHVAKMPVWVEWSESARGECADYEKADGWAVLNVDEFVDVVCFGGRFWTSRPTEEQQKAVKWDE